MLSQRRESMAPTESTVKDHQQGDRRAPLRTTPPETAGAPVIFPWKNFLKGFCLTDIAPTVIIGPDKSI
jgi:hypothetical protein